MTIDDAPLLLLRADQWYSVFGETARSKFGIIKEGWYTQPVTYFILPDRVISIKYNLTKREYTFSEPVEFAIKYDPIMGAWSSNVRGTTKPKDTTIYDDRVQT